MLQDIDKFEILESKINKLIESFSSLKSEKTALEKKLIQKDMEVKELMQKLDCSSQEREKVKKKVEDLLIRVDRLISPDK
jgi:hypothetical protein